MLIMQSCKFNLIENFRLFKALSSDLINSKYSRSQMFSWNWVQHVRKSTSKTFIETLTCSISSFEFQHLHMLHMQQNRISEMSSADNKHKNVRSVAASDNICFNFRNYSFQDINKDDADIKLTFKLMMCIKIDNSRKSKFLMRCSMCSMKHHEEIFVNDCQWSM